MMGQQPIMAVAYNPNTMQMMNMVQPGYMAMQPSVSSITPTVNGKKTKNKEKKLTTKNGKATKVKHMDKFNLTIQSAGEFQQGRNTYPSLPPYLLREDSWTKTL